LTPTPGAAPVVVVDPASEASAFSGFYYHPGNGDDDYDENNNPLPEHNLLHPRDYT